MNPTDRIHAAPSAGSADTAGSTATPTEAPVREAVQDKLALYHFDACPYCAFVRRAIEAQGLKVELRNIHEDRTHWEDLVAARSRSTVPVLRIERPDGSVEWMPESRDIVKYLQETY